jgi:D-alanyl-D-alanine carboxypeptidase
LQANHPRWRQRTDLCSCAVGVCAVSIFAVAVTASPVAARHSPHSHGVHGKHESPHESSYTPPYAAIVLDMNSGKVLHSDKADELRHPASLTKIMTLYLLFDRLDSGRIRLDSQLPVSEHAAAQAPTKLGLKPGDTIEVEDAIRGLVTKSANDAAVAVAEALGGSEHDFAEMMTAKAHALGMSRTLYRNASGLPNDEQVTTARDQATLGRAIQERFPRYYRYFATPSFTYHGETMHNHNKLLGRVDGMDGIKTGYTQASGFNLVASVRRNDRHIVSVVMGGTSAGARDARMRSLIEDYIGAATSQKTLVAGVTPAKPDVMHKDEARKDEARKDEARKDEARLTAMVRTATATPSPPPESRPAETGPAEGASTSGTYTVASTGPATEPIKPIQVKTLKVKMAPGQMAALAPQPSTLTPPAAGAPPNAAAEAPKREPERDLIAEAIREAMRKDGVSRDETDHSEGTARRQEKAPAQPAAVHSGWMIQVGAFDVEKEARERISIVQAKAGQMLKHADPFTEAVTAGDKTFYRARFAGIQKDQAEAICKQLKRNDIACMAIKN